MTDIEEQAERLVRQNVHYCISGLVSTLASGNGIREDADLSTLCEQASELCAPVQDYEEAARSAGWESYKDKFGVCCWREASGDDGRTWAGDAEELCSEYDIDPYEWEIYEHWIVSDWLAERLAAHGERVDTDFAGLTVWGRTTTGQAISMDSVILAIAREFHKVAA